MFTYYLYSIGSKLIRLVILVSLALTILLVLNAPPVFAAPGISQIAVSNVRDTTFTVSWTTDVVVTGTINYGTTTALGSIGNDVRGAGTSSTTHYVTVSGLNPSIVYYFDVVSGSTVANNGGSHFTVTTGPTIGLPGSDTVYGQVFKSDHATLAVGTIVLINLVDGNPPTGSPGSSAMASALVDGTGYWFYNLGNVRTADLSSYFSYSPAGGDNLQLYAYGGADGNAGLPPNPLPPVSTANDKPVTPIYLDGVPTAVTLSNFAALSENVPGDTILSILAMSGGTVLLAGFWLARKRS